MQEADLLKIIGAQRPPVGVIGVGGNQGVLQSGWTPDLHHHRSMSKYILIEAELDKVTRLQLTQRGRNPKGSRARRLTGDKVKKILHTGPGRGLVVGIPVKPAVDWVEVHHARSGVQALGGKIGTVAADLLVVIEIRISSVGPLMGIGHSGTAVIGYPFQHSALPFPHILCRRAQKGHRLSLRTGAPFYN